MGSSERATVVPRLVIGTELGARLLATRSWRPSTVQVVDEVPAGPVIAGHVYADPRLLAEADVLPRGLTSSRLTLIDPTPERLSLRTLPLWARGAKRMVDITAALSGLVLLAVPMLIIATMVKLDSRGSALFTQQRMGRDGRLFRMYKFRTMSAGNDTSAHQEYVAKYIQGSAERQAGDVYKMADDPRITRLGRRLRMTSLDELPQLWNVLKGDMSLIGPRPCLPYEADLFDGDSWQRLRVKPGITGLWQVSGRTRLSHREAIALDVRYWSEWTLRMELSIVYRTPIAVVRGVGAV